MFLKDLSPDLHFETITFEVFGATLIGSSQLQRVNVREFSTTRPLTA